MLFNNWKTTGEYEWRDTGRPPRGEYTEQEMYKEQVSLKTGDIRWVGTGCKHLCRNGEVVLSSYLYSM